MGRCACNLQKGIPAGRFPDTVRQDTRQLSGCGAVFLLNGAAVLLNDNLRCIQPVGRDKPCVLTAQLCRFLIHLRRKGGHGHLTLLRSVIRRIFLLQLRRQKLFSHIFGQRHRGIIMGFQHQGMEQVPDCILLPLLYVQFDLRHTGGISGYGKRIIQ